MHHPASEKKNCDTGRPSAENLGEAYTIVQSLGLHRSRGTAGLLDISVDG